MIQAERRFRDFLASKGLRFTGERRRILERVFRNHAHFEAQELVAGLQRRKQRVSRATVYRTLSLLVESGLLREVLSGEQHRHFEHVFGHGHHDHLLCLRCGKIIEFADDELEEIQRRVCKKKRFIPVRHRLEIRGYCRKCS